jgi:hypothetical protein
MNTIKLFPNQLVKYKNGTYKIVSINFGGKCKIKKTLLPNKGKVFNEVDINDLTPIF